jgi:hypothetical protein
VSKIDPENTRFYTGFADIKKMRNKDLFFTHSGVATGAVGVVVVEVSEVQNSFKEREQWERD